MWVLIRFLSVPSGTAASFSRWAPRPMILSLSLAPELELLAFCFLAWLPSQLLLLPRSWKKTKIVNWIPFHYSRHHVLDFSCPFCNTPSPTLFHFMCAEPSMVMVLPVGFWLSKDLATLAEQSLGGPFGEVGIPTPGSVPRHRRQGVWESSGHAGHSCKGHTVFPHLPAALAKNPIE